MKYRLIFRILIAVALAAAAFGIWQYSTLEEIKSPVLKQITIRHSGESWNPGASVRQKPIDSLPFIDLKQFGRSWSAAESAKAISGQPVAGVVNHHFLAADLMAHFFRALRLSRPGLKRFIIISPDHFRVGGGAISVTDRAYLTPLGAVAVASSSAQALVGHGSATLEDGQMFEHEHGVGALVPFIKHEFPDAELLPIAVRGDLDRTTAKDFGQVLAGIADDSTFILVSSDMSHYLSEAQALGNDKETLARLATFDERFFASAKDDHVDNGVGLIILAGYLEAKGIKPSFRLLDHKISSDYGADRLSTTSYINGFWIE